MNAKNPSDITKKLNMDICLMCNRCPDVLHRTRLSKGERTNKMEGIPMTKCNLSGNGKTTAPAIDIE
jgi:hypothetical protein